MEITTFHGHFNAWGTATWVDFRVQNPPHMAAALDFASRGGALTACNHPKPYGPPWDYAGVANYDCIEVWNGPWQAMNQASLDFWLAQIGTGRRIPAVGGSDFHRTEETADTPRAPGTPTMWVFVNDTPSPASILQAIRAGHASLSAAPGGPFLDLRAGAAGLAMAGDALEWPARARLPVRIQCHNAGRCLLRLLDQRGVLFEHAIAGSRETVEAEVDVEGSLYVRAELRESGGSMGALTNPVYCAQTQSRL
jgi:hypothetical protein